MNSDVKNTIREALDAMKLAARYSTVLSRDEDEYREAMQQAEAIAVRADAALAALVERDEPQPAIPPDVRETIKTMCDVYRTVVGATIAYGRVRAWLDAA